MRLLLVTYEFPPKGGPGVQRPLKLVKYLTRFGWDSTVLTVAEPPTALVDATLETELPASARVMRAWSLEPTRAIQLLKRLRGGSSAAAAAARSGAVGYSAAPSWLVRLVQGMFVPDEKRFWKPWAVRVGAAAATADRCTVVVSSGPPHTAHLVGAAVARRLGLPHVVDLRDPWVGAYHRRYATPLHRVVDAWLERRTVLDARAVVTVTERMAEMYRERYPGTRVLVIPNGFDPADLPEPVAVSHEGFVLAYTGTFGGARQPDSLLAGVALAESRHPGLAQDLRIIAAGPGQEFADAARRAGVRSGVEALGYVSHAQSLQVLASADVALLVLSAGEESRVSLSGKVFEYLGMRKPILAVVGAGPAGELVGATTGGRVASFDDPEAIAIALGELYSAWRSGGLAGPTDDEANSFSRIEQAQAYAALLEEVVADAR